MKKSVSILFVAMVCLMLTSSVFAAFQEIYMVNDKGSTTAQDIFTLDDTPWLYLKLPVQSYNVTSSWWTSPTNSAYYLSNLPSTDYEIWLSPLGWDTIKEAGVWNVSALYYYANNPGDSSGMGKTCFTVTPEPLGCALFALGGMALAFFRRKRRTA